MPPRTSACCRESYIWRKCALLAVKPEIRPPLLPLDRSDAEDRPSTARRAAQAARAGLEMGGWQLPHPVVNLDDPSDFPSHQVVLRHCARVVAARERAYSTGIAVRTSAGCH